jgi:DNA-binding response OmpR family regulator
MSQAGWTILVADDDPVILGLLEVNFEMEGFTVVTAENGADALERAREAKPDILVLDVMMPKMTGHEVAAAIRDDPDLAGTPVIFVSAKAQGADVAVGMDLGAVDYVTKPFDPIDLVERVNVALEKSTR